MGLDQDGIQNGAGNRRGYSVDDLARIRAAVERAEEDFRNRTTSGKLWRLVRSLIVIWAFASVPLVWFLLVSTKKLEDTLTKVQSQIVQCDTSEIETTEE